MPASGSDSERELAKTAISGETPQELTAAHLVEFRDTTLMALRIAVQVCWEMIDNRDLANSVKLKWVHGLAQTSGVLCNILKGMGQLKMADPEAEMSLARLLMKFKEVQKTTEDVATSKKFRARNYVLDWVKALLEEIAALVEDLLERAKRKTP